MTKKFDLDVSYIILFPQIKPSEPTPWLKESLRRAKLSPPTNEKSKAERIVSPVLMEILNAYADKISFFSGESLDVDPENDLSGACDFFFALHPPKPYVDAPIISLAESKDEDMEWGVAQCAAQLYGADLFNKKEGKNISVLYGCATDGVEWQFMKFEAGVFYLHNEIITDLNQLLGVWHYIIQIYLV